MPSVLLFLGCGFDRGGLAAEPFVEAAVTDSATSTDITLLFDSDEDEGLDTALTMDTEVPVDTAPPCAESGAVMFEGHCYFIVAGPNAFGDARAACAAASPPAHLVAITSASEQAAAIALGGPRELWIGLRKATTDPSTRASFKWITGEPVTYNGWAPEDPNGGHDCARLRSDGLWGDFPCSTTLPGICERE